MALPKRRIQPKTDERGTRPTGSPHWRALYEIENLPEVERYVSRHPTAAAVLVEAPREIAAVFGDDIQPGLRLTCDPEDGDCWLAVRIPVDDAGPAALPLIDALDERWWLRRMASTDAVIVFDVVGR